MKVWKGDPRSWGPGPETGTALTIGVFDGIHRGHQALLTGLAGRARRMGDLPIVVVTFDIHPRALLNPDRAPKTLLAMGRRLEILESLGVDQVGVLPFRTVQPMEPDEFVRQVVVNGFNGRMVLVGEGFHYGAKRSGSVTSLAESGRTHGFIVEARNLLFEGSVPISSSRIRGFIASGAVAMAGDMLGRPHELTTAHGVDQLRVSDLGTAIADVDFGAGMAVPAPGVYAVRLVAGNRVGSGICLIRERHRTMGVGALARIHFLDRRRVQEEGLLNVRFFERIRGVPSRNVDPSPTTVLRQDIARARDLLIQRL